MEHTLRCNALKCRKEVKDQAVVTTCSHIFCLECANQLQLSSPPSGQRPVCPACDAHLTNPDDAAITNLNPTEDYKTSVLSGLSPTIIMECAGRALSFWSYQTSQEVVYQEYLSKSLTDKYTGLTSQMDKVVHDANIMMSGLRDKMNNMSVDQESLRRKNKDLIQALREKHKKYLQTQELYDKLKRRAMLGQVQNAATDAVDYTLQASMAHNRYVRDVKNPTQAPRQLSLFSEAQNDRQLSSVEYPHIPQPVARSMRTETWNSFSNQDNIQHAGPIQTPSDHRQRLAAELGRSILDFQPGVALTTSARRETRPPLSSFSPSGTTSRNGFSGYGMSAGLKVSNPPTTAHNHDVFARPTIRSRVAQRPGIPQNGGQANGYY